MFTLARASTGCPKPGPSLRNCRDGLRLATVLAGIVLLSLMPVQAQKNKDPEEIGKRDINSGSMNFFSIEREIALGLEYSKQIESTTVLLKDPVVQDYVDNLVQRLVRNSDAYSPFTVKIVDADEINAFALPGGFLYVNTGLILQARTEAELAGMLAHEIAHVTARHYTKNQSKAKLMQWLSIPLIFVGGPAGVALQQGIGLTGPLALLKFARNQERDADLLGLQYAYRSGYDPVALVDILERLGDKDTENQLARVFSTHPMKKDRIKRAQIEIGQVFPARDTYVVSTASFDKIKARLARRYHNRRWYEPGSNEGPRLRRKTGSQ